MEYHKVRSQDHYYLFFINDIFFFVEKSDIWNYADDNTLSIADISNDNIIKILESNISNLHTWLKHNGMLFSEPECHFMVVGQPSESSRDEVVKIKISNKTVNETKKS